MRRLLLALATVAPLFVLSSAPADAWGWSRSYGYGPDCRPNYYRYSPAYGYRPYYGAYWRPRGYFYRPYRPWRARAYRPYRAWAWGRGWRRW